MNANDAAPLVRAQAAIVRAFLATEALADLDGDILTAAAAVAARAVTPAPPLTCPRCEEGRVWMTDDGGVCRDTDGAPGCGAEWDPIGLPT